MRAAPPDLEALSAQEVLAHVVAEHHPRLYVACSFQKEASVILDILLGIEPRARVFTLDTGVLFPETYETWRRTEQRYEIEIDVYRGEWIDGLWQRDPDACCGMRKVEPLERALAEVDAWITGLRRDQSPARAGTPKLGPDSGHPGKLKCAPLADWSDKDVWRYIAEHDVPYHPLHDRGYDSIGCMHCTVAGGGRDGRWAGTDKIECGLHLVP
ncbi:MAG: phosphoadenylyl-sulfate reductase [Actinophytocola sp.]|uniref:phosphoadenylyl-sulfate reductase n=1 Tax=Actinophytocola sp. TaxID=1872138 RepID=UPI003D6BFC81